jgi:hypothetical protein
MNADFHCCALAAAWRQTEPVVGGHIQSFGSKVELSLAAASRAASDDPGTGQVLDTTLVGIVEIVGTVR